MNVLKSKVVVVERIILWKTAWKDSSLFKSYADLFNTQIIFKHGLSSFLFDR